MILVSRAYHTVLRLLAQQIVVYYQISVSIYDFVWRLDRYIALLGTVHLFLMPQITKVPSIYISRFQSHTHIVQLLEKVSWSPCRRVILNILENAP